MKKIGYVVLLWSGLLFAKSDYLTCGIGVHDILRDKHRTAEFLLEYKWGYHFKDIHPFIGAMITAKGASYLYGGFSLDWKIKNHLVLSPSLAAGYYQKGAGKDLGYPLEFRSSFAVGWQFFNSSRLSFAFYHISNASLGRRNPGSESLVLCYSFPFF